MKRPLVIVALLYVGGILLADLVSFPLPLLFAASLLLAVATLGWRRGRPYLLVPLLALVGAANYTLRTAVLSPDDLRLIGGDTPALVTVRGTLPETPYHRVYDHGETETWRTLAPLEVTAIRFEGTDWRPAFGRVAVNTPGVLPETFYSGVEVKIAGVLRQPPAVIVEGAFDYQTYLNRHGIYYQLQAATPADWRLIPNPRSPASPPLSDRFIAWAQKNLALGLPDEDGPLRLLWTMTLGWKTGMTGEVAQPFMRSGTMHIFAISGLHIALIAGILVALLRVLQMPRGVCGLVVVPLIWFYTAVTGWQASAIRSTVMMTIIIVGWSLRRPSDLINSLAAAAFVILIWDPHQIFQASFQLSFFVVLSLALFAPVFEKLRRRWLQPDPLLPAQLRPRGRRWLDEPLHWLAAAFMTSLAAWLGSIPLVAYYFHLFTPVSLLANLIVIPLSSLALASNLASLIVGGWFPAAAELFNHSAWFWMLLMSEVSEWAARLPGGWTYVNSPSLVSFALYYAALISLMAGWLAKPKVRWWVAIAIGILSVIWIFQWQRERTSTRLTFIPVNGGSAIFCDAPGRDNDLLVDCGNQSAAQFAMQPFLRSQGVNHLGNLLLTHGDIRQVGGAELVAGDFSPGTILTSSVRFRSAAYRNFVEALPATPQRWRQIHRGDHVGIWNVLHPEPTDHPDRADDGAVVLLGDFDGTRVLLLSDLGGPGQRLLLERQPDLRADIVVAGLPTAGEPLMEALLDSVQPRVVVVTDSEFPATRRASPQLRERLGKRGVPVIYTRTTGAAKLTLHAGRWELQTMNGQTIKGDSLIPQPVPRPSPHGFTNGAD